MVQQCTQLEAILSAPDISDYLCALRPINAEPVLAFLMPVRVVSEANERCHHLVRFRRKKAQAEETHVEWKRNARGVRIALPCIVRLIRIGPRRLDDDNLASGFKGIRDQIARELGVDDGSDLVRFEYDQVVTRRRVYGVKVEVYPTKV